MSWHLFLLASVLFVYLFVVVVLALFSLISVFHTWCLLVLFIYRKLQCDTFWCFLVDVLQSQIKLSYLYSGLSVVYLSGKHTSNGHQFGKYTQDDVDALRALAEDPGVVDLFLTYPFFPSFIIFVVCWLLGGWAVLICTLR